jgi:hypothetical protein
VLGRRAHRELVHVRLADDDRADVPEPLGDVGVVRRSIALEDARTRGALPALDRDQVLERDRYAQQRVEGVHGGRALTTSRFEPGVGGAGLGQRAVAVDGQPGVQAVVLALGKIEMGGGQLG